MRFHVEFYEKSNGEQPAREFLLALDKKMRVKLLSMIAILENNGYELRDISLRVSLNFAQNLPRTSRAFSISSTPINKLFSPTDL